MDPALWVTLICGGIFLSVVAHMYLFFVFPFYEVEKRNFWAYAIACAIALTGIIPALAVVSIELQNQTIAILPILLDNLALVALTIWVRDSAKVK